MFQSSRDSQSLSSIFENSTVTVCNYSEETFSVLTFDDLILPGSPCLNENLIEMSKLLEMPMDHQQPQPGGLAGAAEGDACLSCNPSEAQLSPGVDFSPDVYCGKSWFLESPDTPTKNLPEFTEDFRPFLPLSDNGILDTKNLGAILGLGAESATDTPPVATNRPATLEEQIFWLANTEFSEGALIAGEEAVSETKDKVIGKKQKEVVLEIPSTVDDSILSEIVATSSNQTAKPSSSKTRKRRSLNVEPGTEEYKKKRELNNISVRKSREKSRKKQQETEERVEVLSAENDRLQERVDSLEKELTILRGLFTNIGAKLPEEFNSLLSAD